MTKKIKRQKLAGKNSQKRTLTLSCLCALFILSSLSFDHSQDTQVTFKASLLETLTGLPAKIIDNAWDNGGVAVFIWGTEKEKHSFAKGYSTRFGQMDFDADAYLKHGKGWNEEKIHDLGHQYGFSKN